MRTGVPTAQGVSCVTQDPDPTHAGGPQEALLQMPNGPSNGPSVGQGSEQGGRAEPGMVKPQSGFGVEPVAINGSGQTVSDMPQTMLPGQYQKFDNQVDLGHWLMDKYHIRSANELSSCEVCHR